MGTCKYCGKSAGFFRSKHAECEEQYQKRQHVIEEGRQKIAAEALRAIKSADNFDDLENLIVQIERLSFVPLVDRKTILVKSWETAVEDFLDDGILDATEEKRLVEFKERFYLSQSDLDKSGAITKITKAAVLRDVLNGVIPKRFSIDGNLPINLQKGEQIIWAFPNSKYLEDKIRRQFIGSSQGMSVRVMKGVYYRAGAFKGHSVEHTERVHIDTGWVVITNKNIYFAGGQKSVRIPYAKIVSFEPYSDGLGIMRDASNAKAQIFVTGDGWFAYNLVTNVSQL